MEKIKLMGVWAFFGLLMFLLMSAKNVHSITCQEAVTKFSNCLPFLVATDPSPSFACCDAVKAINQAASTTEVRRFLCQCLKDAARGFHVNPDRAKELPDKCSVQVPVPISIDIDCSKIKAVKE